jgi:hypothetical protein
LDPYTIWLYWLEVANDVFNGWTLVWSRRSATSRPYATWRRAVESLDTVAVLL